MLQIQSDGETFKNSDFACFQEKVDFRKYDCNLYFLEPLRIRNTKLFMEDLG